MLAECDSSKSYEEYTDKDGNAHDGTIKMDATCCDAKVRYPTDCNLLADSSKFIGCILNKFCARSHTKEPYTHVRRLINHLLN